MANDRGVLLAAPHHGERGADDSRIDPEHGGDAIDMALQLSGGLRNCSPNWRVVLTS